MNLEGVVLLNSMYLMYSGTGFIDLENDLFSVLELERGLNEEQIRVVCKQMFEVIIIYCCIQFNVLFTHEYAEHRKM